MNAVEKFMQVATPKQRQASDLGKKFSYGKDGKTALMIPVTTTRFGFTMSNYGEEDLIVVLGGIPAGITTESTTFAEIFQNITGLSLDNVVILGEDTDNGGTPVKPVFVTVPKVSTRSVDYLRYFTTQTPTQVRKLIMKSTNLDTGAEESTNYDGLIKTYHSTPFEREISTEEINLMDGQKPSDNRVGIMHYDFVKNGRNVILGNESIVTITLKAGTRFSIDMLTGAQNSSEQELYRGVNMQLKNLLGFYNQITPSKDC